MGDSFLKYLPYEKRYSPKTLLAYQTDLQQFQDFLNKDFDAMPSAEANHALVRSWVVSLVENKIDAASVNRKIACLRSYYKFLLRQEVITKDPMTKIKILKTKKKLPHFVQETDMMKVLDQIKFAKDFEGRRDQLVLELLYGTGMRLAELIGLKDLSINLKDRTLKVLGKRNKERVIPFTQSLVQLIVSYRTIRNQEIERKNESLLVTDKGLPLYPVLVNRIVKKYLKNSNVDKKRPH